MKYGDKYYRDLPDLSFQELNFRNMEGNAAVFHDQNNATVKLSGNSLAMLGMSRIIVLTELEEKIQKKLSEVHQLMRDHGMSFNPANKPNVIYKRATLKEVHKYDKKTGRYIESYSSVSEAILSVGGGNSKRRLDYYKTYKGFKWSYQKVNRL